MQTLRQHATTTSVASRGRPTQAAAGRTMRLSSPRTEIETRGIAAGRTMWTWRQVNTKGPNMCRQSEVHILSIREIEQHETEALIQRRQQRRSRHQQQRPQAAAVVIQIPSELLEKGKGTDNEFSKI